MKYILILADSKKSITEYAKKTVPASEKYEIDYYPVYGKVYEYLFIDRKNLVSQQKIDNKILHKILFFKDNYIDFEDIFVLINLRENYKEKEDFVSAKDINQLINEIEVFEKKDIFKSFPQSLQIESTSFCNAECIMCRHFYQKNTNARSLEIEIVKELSSALPYVFDVVINGYGEPFLSATLNEQMELYRHYACNITTNTNLSFVNEQIIEWINSMFRQIEISCDGASKKTFEEIRKNLSFNKFIKNLKLLREKCPDVLIRFSVVAMRQNIQELNAIVELAKEFGVYLITFVNIGTDVIIRNQADSIYNYPAAFWHAFEEAKKTGKKYGIIIDTPYIEADEYALDSRNQKRELKMIADSLRSFELDQDKVRARYNEFLNKKNSPKHWHESDTDIVCEGICDWLVNRCYIDLEGEVFPCCTNHKKSMGNLHNEGLFQIWNGAEYVKMRKIFHSGKIPGSCLGCSHIVDRKLHLLHLTDDELNRYILRSEEYKRNRESGELDDE